MQPSFWHNCWQRSSYGFHQLEFHPFLSSYIAPLLAESNATIFVPLCGKSLDMFWFAENMQVVGAELSAIACRDFFEDRDLPYINEPWQQFNCYRNESITLLQGDFFSLDVNELPVFDYIYDRAALIALPKEMQFQYAQQLKSFITRGTTLFLLSLEFPEHEMSGPPFPVFQKDIKALFNEYHIECIAEHALDNKQFAQRTFNVSELIERLYVIKQR